MSGADEPLAASEMLLFARVLDDATRAGLDDEQLLPVLDLICAIARSDAAVLEVGTNGRGTIRCGVGTEIADGREFDLRASGGHLGRVVIDAPSNGADWSAVERELLEALADLMAERFERALATESTRLAVVQLSAALESRVIIEQAKGMLAERHSVPVDAAFEHLRSAARQQRRTLHEVARDVVKRTNEPSARLRGY